MKKYFVKIVSTYWYEIEMKESDFQEIKKLDPAAQVNALDDGLDQGNFESAVVTEFHESKQSE